MRKIKFRGKRADNGEWEYGDLLQICGGCCIYFGSKSETQTPDIPEGSNVFVELMDSECAVVRPSTICQFTGLTDCNGKEIYEGDIITVNGRYPRVVLWDKMSWSLMPTKFYQDKYFWVMNLQHPGPDWWEKFAGEFEVIGNIHDNPELIK